MSVRSQPVSAVGRGAVAGGAIARAGALLLRDRLRRSFQNAGEQEDSQQTNRQAIETLYRAAGQLRGTALKVAQILHWESAYAQGQASDALYQACYQAPPMVSSLVAGIFERQLGRPPWRLFDAFEPQPFAAASIGQVHAARIGEARICVKVQYPGILASIQTDLMALKVIARSLPQHRLLLRLLPEIEARLREECDYRLEQMRTQWFADTLQLPGVDVPATFPDFCRDSLLTQQRLRGSHLREWLATHPSQDGRDRCAQQLDAVFTRSFYELQRVHADPHPGNYLFRDDGTVGMVDFGCVKDVTPDFAGRVSAIIRAHVSGNRRHAFELTCEFGFFGPLTEEDSWKVSTDLLEPFVSWLVRPLQTERFDFAAHPGFASEGGRLFLAVVTNAPHGAIYPDFMFVCRTVFGLYRIYESLGATVGLRNRWVSH